MTTTENEGETQVAEAAVVPQLAAELDWWRDKIPASALALAEEAGPLEPDTPEQVRKELEAARGATAWSRWCKMIKERYARYATGEQALDYFGDLTPEQRPDDLRRWCKSTSQTLILHGPTGRGKTKAAIDLGYHEASFGVHTTIISQLDYLAKLRPGGSDDPGRERYRAATTTLLILDDFGAETEDGTEFVRREICALLDARINNKLRTVITTNATPEELIRAFGARIISRMREDSIAIKIEGRDWRQARNPADPW